MMNHIPFGGGISLALAPTDLNAGVSSAYCKVQDTNEFLVLSLLADAAGGTAHPVVSLTEAKDAAGTDAQTLNLKRVYWKKGSGTGNQFLQADDVFTKESSITPESPAASFDTAGHTPGDADYVLSVLVRPIDLSEGFTHVRVNFTCPAAKVGCVAVNEIGKSYQAVEIPGPVDGV